MTFRPSRALTGDSRNALILTVGRTVGFVVAFAIPIVLVRVLDQQAFGTYKYLFLLSTTLTVLQCGLAESLYYFIPRLRAEAPRAIANALLLLFAIGGLIVIPFVAAGSWLAPRLVASEAAPYLPELAWLLAGVLISMPLEIVMVARHRYVTASVTYAASDIVRATLLTVPALLMGTLHAVMIGAALFGVARIAAVVIYVGKAFGRRLGWDATVAKQQCVYVIPFAFAVVLETVQVNLHQFIVWSHVDPARFAIYAAGCLQIPFVDLLATSVGNVMMVRMADERTSPVAVRDLWRQAVGRLALVLCPLVVALLLTARDLITVLFTASYAGAVPVFMVSTAVIALAVLPVDSVLRARADTRFLIVMNVVRLAVVIVAIVPAMRIWGLPGAMATTAAGMAAAKIVALRRIASSIDVGWAALLPWRALAGIATASLLAAAPVLMLSARLPHAPLMRGAVVTAIYLCAYAASLAVAAAVARRAPAVPLEWADPEHP